jgi:hypothetical protein
LDLFRISSHTNPGQAAFPISKFSLNISPTLARNVRDLRENFNERMGRYAQTAEMISGMSPKYMSLV